jgi:Cytochrome c oxidase assembly protein CtaG/Cox11
VHGTTIDTRMKLSSSILAAFLLLLVSPLKLPAAELIPNMRDPGLVIQAYLRATYARDSVQAYRFISSDDRRVRDLNRYVQLRGKFNGFALEAAKKLSEYMEINVSKKVVAPDRIRAVASYKAPDPNKTRALLRNAYQLNLVPEPDRKQIIESIEKSNRDGTLEMIAREETFDLIKEGDEWRIFFNWAAGIRIGFRALPARSSEVEVSLSKDQLVVQPGDMFEVFLTIKNPSKKESIVEVNHLLEPRDVTHYLDLVQCDVLEPVRVRAGKEQEYSATYLLRANFPEGIHQFSLTYGFSSHNN